MGEQARLKGGVALRRFLRGALAAYRRFLFTADPAAAFSAGQRFLRSVRGSDRLEGAGELGHEVSGSAPDGPYPGCNR